MSRFRSAARTNLTLGLAVLALEACICTAIGCSDGFEIDFASKGSWPSATYEVVITTDGSTSSATVVLPFESCAVGPAYSGTHDWTLIQSGCALSPSEHSLGGITFAPAMPAHVEVVVTMDGQEVAAGSYAPIYQHVQPNGPMCGPTCLVAPSETLEVSFSD